MGFNKWNATYQKFVIMPKIIKNGGLCICCYHIMFKWINFVHTIIWFIYLKHFYFYLLRIFKNNTWVVWKVFSLFVIRSSEGNSRFTRKDVIKRSYFAGNLKFLTSTSVLSILTFTKGNRVSSDVLILVRYMHTRQETNPCRCYPCWWYVKLWEKHISL